MEAPKKILIVGESLTGKSSIVCTFRDYEPCKQDSKSSNNYDQSPISNVSQSTFAGTNIDATMEFCGQQNCNDADTKHMSPTLCHDAEEDYTPKKKHLQGKTNSDFSLKFMYIDGKKVRLQLWDQGQKYNPQTTFQPLFTRHVSGCIIVANTSNPDSIKKAQIWKEYFDEKTKVKDEPTIPCTLFINHDKPVERKSQVLNMLEPIKSRS